MQIFNFSKKKIEKKNESIKSNKIYDLLLLYIQMHVMDGFEVLKRIRKNKILKDIYVIALTANAIKNDVDHIIKSGCNDYLSKPIEKKLKIK